MPDEERTEASRTRHAEISRTLGELTGMLHSMGHQMDRHADAIDRVDRKVSNGLTHRVDMIGKEVDGLQESVGVIQGKCHHLDGLTASIEGVRTTVQSLQAGCMVHNGQMQRTSLGQIGAALTTVATRWRLISLVVVIIGLGGAVIFTEMTATEAFTFAKSLVVGPAAGK